MSGIELAVCVNPMRDGRLLNIPVILGTSRQGRASAHVARLFVDLLDQRAGVESSLVDIATLALPVDDAGETIKSPAFAAAMRAADGLVIVAPEYNHSFPGLLKHVLDSCLSEYVHKAAGLVGVSAGPFAGVRVVQSLLPVMREIGLVNIFWDVNIGSVGSVFGDDGRLLDEAVIRRSERFVRELIWMCKVLRYGREHVSVDEDAAGRSPAVCACGAVMTHHAEKEVGADAGVDSMVVTAVHACESCGAQQERLEVLPR